MPAFGDDETRLLAHPFEARGAALPEVGIVEVESYWTPDTEAGAVVMLTDADVPEWPRTYRQKCLAGENVEAREEPAEGSPLKLGGARHQPPPARTTVPASGSVIRADRVHVIA